MCPSQTYASERDFVANYLLPTLKEAAKSVGLDNVLEFHVEKPVDGIADLTVERGGRGVLVVEAKFKKKVAALEYDIEPRDPAIIDQALTYAARGGYAYYATCNARRLVLFQLRPGVRAYESEVLSVDYSQLPGWSIEVLKIVTGLVLASLKPIDETLVDLLQEAFRDLYPRIHCALDEKIQLESQFRERYEDWLKNQGLKIADDTNRLIAEQATYLQLNKLLFYKVIESLYPDRLKPLRIDDGEDVRNSLLRFFEDVRKIDYAPIYESDIISEIPLSGGATERLRTLVDTLAQFDFSRMESDFLGRIYEKLITPAERKRLGQFYTPQDIVDLIIELTVTNPNSLILDPGCGSGTFLKRAYHKIRELNGVPKSLAGPLAEPFHQEILDKIYGIDINQFPAHLSVINLALQNPRTRVQKVNVIVGDFFDIKPGYKTLAGFSGLTAEGQATVVEFPPSFDVVMANPPYIRQELLGEKEKDKIKRLIEEIEYKHKLFIGKSAEKPPKGAIVLEKQSDIYIYFYTHGLALLKNGGRLGFISSNKWLEVGYGEPFQIFLLNTTKILYVIEFDEAVFPEAEVNTAVTVVQKEKDAKSRNQNLVKFVRLKQHIEPDKLIQLLERTKESFEDELLKVNIVAQNRLQHGKWNSYLRSPPILLAILKSTKLKPLGELANVFFGIKTGYNDYFILSREAANSWGIESRFLKPTMASPKKVRGLILRQDDIDEYLFLCHKSKHQLKGTNALRYIEYGERLKVKLREVSAKPRELLLTDVPSIKGRDPWYDLPEYNIPSIIIQELYDKETRAIWNEAGAHARAPLYYCIPRKKLDAKVICAFLNSSVAMMLFELYGRSYGGGVLDIKVYEAREVPVLDPECCSKDEKRRIEKSFSELAKAIDQRVRADKALEDAKPKGRAKIGLFEQEAEQTLQRFQKAEREARYNLDRAICDVLGLTRAQQLQVEAGVEELLQIRLRRAGRIK